MRIAYSDLDIRFSVDQMEFCVLNIIYERLSRRIPPHSHGPGCYEIHYIDSGYGKSIINGVVYTISPNTIYVTGPGVEHSQISDTQNPMCEYCIYMRLLKKGGKRLSHPSRSILAAFLETYFWIGQDTENLGTLFQSIFQEFSQQRDGYILQIQSLLQQIPVTLARCYAQGKPSSNHFLPSDLHNSNTVIIEEFFLYEYQNCTLDALAEKLRLSNRQTERLLQKQYGMTFTEKRTQARLAAASVLLQETSLSITEIAQETGFSSGEYFTNTFRKHYGVSPRAYRKRSNTPLSQNASTP